jgi:hypothetical protein
MRALCPVYIGGGEAALCALIGELVGDLADQVLIQWRPPCTPPVRCPVSCGGWRREPCVRQWALTSTIAANDVSSPVAWMRVHRSDRTARASTTVAAG